MTKAGIEVVAAPLRKQVIELLRNAIMSFDYGPGQRLVERDLCERFDVSRTVIREALRHLEAEGLVELVPNRGPIVSSPTFNEGKGLYEVREALEALAARLCAERATPAEKKRVERALQQVAAAYEKDDLPRQLLAKDEFYARMCEGAHNEAIASMLRSIKARVQMLRSLSLQSPGRLDESLTELEEVVGAINKGDGALAAKLASRHVRNAASTALGMLSEEVHDGKAPVRSL